MGSYLVILLVVIVGGLAINDIRQRKHSILRNFPVLGHFRYWLETVGPELRQYIVTNDNEERPFSRSQRRWVYASSKRENNYFGFGTSRDLECTSNHLIIKHSSFPLADPQPGQADYDPNYTIACSKVLGAARQRRKSFRPNSVVNISGMSFGSLSGPAIQALNAGAQLARALHNTGEGGISQHHLQGGDLVFQIGTGYFGCRDAEGRFCLEKLCELVATHPIRALEIKLSQGAKPGVGGLLPSAKITREIAKARGIPIGRDCISPNHHREFRDVDSLLDFVEQLADATGLPVGIKSAVGGSEFWQELARLMDTTGRGVDFITIDGGEGGTGAAPLVFSDHVAHPFKVAINRVYREFAERQLQDSVVFAGSGKLGFPESAAFAFALGCDLINVAREAMLALGCIQAQRCHTGHCPAGIATQNRWLMRGLDPTLKSARLANYLVTLRKELLRLSRACGLEHPALLMPEHFDILQSECRPVAATEVFGIQPHYKNALSPKQESFNSNH